MTAVLDDISAVELLFGGAGLLSLLAFAALILVPTMGSFGRAWEKAVAGVLSLFVLTVLLAVGFGIGIVIVYYWSDLTGMFG